MLFRKSQPNPFLVIEKSILIFQNIHDYLHVPYPLREGCNVNRRVEKWIRWILLIIGRFKLNFDGLRMQNKSALRWVSRDFNDIINMVAYKYVDK